MPQRDGRARSTTGLVIRNLIFTALVPGTAAVYVPWLILGGSHARPAAWPACAVIAAGVALYGWCISSFTTVGRGTPAPWDAPPRFVAAGPYRWVRNPMYISALTVVLGEAALFLSLSLLLYAGAMAIFFHLFVIGYEEPTLLGRFGATYADYRRNVRRWLPRPPRVTSG